MQACVFFKWEGFLFRGSILEFQSKADDGQNRSCPQTLKLSWEFTKLLPPLWEALAPPPLRFVSAFFPRAHMPSGLCVRSTWFSHWLDYNFQHIFTMPSENHTLAFLQKLYRGAWEVAHWLRALLFCQKTGVWIQASTCHKRLQLWPPGIWSLLPTSAGTDTRMHAQKNRLNL